MDIIVNFAGRPATAATYVVGWIVDGIETVTDSEIRLTVRRAVTDIGPKLPCKGNVMVGRECHRLDAPYIFNVTKAGDVTDFKRRRGK